LDKRRLKFALLGVGIVVTMVFLLAVGISSPGGFAYYMTVSEFKAGGARPDDDVRLNGKVLPGSILREPGRVEFVMHEGGASVPVVYEGIIPDTFVDEADVVVQGELRQDGTFEATVLLAKCPSKYEAAEEAGEEHPTELPM
jgi:cytochrome c-type biogenesis protein CcmE